MSLIDKFIILPLIIVGMFIFILLGSVWGGYGIFRLLLIFKSWGLLP